MARKENPYGQIEGVTLPGFPTSPGSGLVKASARPGKLLRVPKTPQAPKVPKVRRPKIPKGSPY